MAVPEGYTALGRLGYADKGNYAAGTTYMTGDVVYHNGSSYVARKDNLKGVTPVDGNDWKYLARGFAAETMADVQATDTSGVLGTAGAQVVSQSLIDAIADRVMTKLIGTNQIVNNLLATEPGSVLDATQGKALKEYYDRLNSDLDDFKFYKSLEEIGITGTDFTHQAFVDLMPVNSLLLSFVTGLSFLPNTSSYILFVSCTGSSSSKRINFEATEAFGSARGVYKARYAAPAGTQWSGWERDLTNADYEAQNISNSYGLTINLFRFGNDNIKTIKIQGYINKALTAGTEYTIATNVVLKSRVNWYHNVLSGGKGSSSISYMNIDTSGNLKITPQTAIASGSAISIVEYYV